MRVFLPALTLTIYSSLPHRGCHLSALGLHRHPFPGDSVVPRQSCQDSFPQKVLLPQISIAQQFPSCWKLLREGKVAIKTGRRGASGEAREEVTEASTAMQTIRKLFEGKILRTGLNRILIGDQLCEEKGEENGGGRLDGVAALY